VTIPDRTTNAKIQVKTNLSRGYFSLERILLQEYYPISKEVREELAEMAERLRELQLEEFGNGPKQSPIDLARTSGKVASGCTHVQYSMGQKISN
jgi:hypothetical protein